VCTNRGVFRATAEGFRARFIATVFAEVQKNCREQTRK
jgi:hypothetical protein